MKVVIYNEGMRKWAADSPLVESNISLSAITSLREGDKLVYPDQTTEGAGYVPEYKRAIVTARMLDLSRLVLEIHVRDEDLGREPRLERSSGKSTPWSP